MLAQRLPSGEGMAQQFCPIFLCEVQDESCPLIGSRPLACESFLRDRDSFTPVIRALPGESRRAALSSERERWPHRGPSNRENRACASLTRRREDHEISKRQNKISNSHRVDDRPVRSRLGQATANQQLDSRFTNRRAPIG